MTRWGRWAAPEARAGSPGFRLDCFPLGRRGLKGQHVRCGRRRGVGRGPVQTINGPARGTSRAESWSQFEFGVLNLLIVAVFKCHGGLLRFSAFYGFLQSPHLPLIESQSQEKSGKHPGKFRVEFRISRISPGSPLISPDFPNFLVDFLWIFSRFSNCPTQVGRTKIMCR